MIDFQTVTTNSNEWIIEYHHKPTQFYLFLAISIGLLFLITIVKILKDKPFIEVAKYLIISEQASYSFFKNVQQNKLLEQLKLLFFSVQIGYLIGLVYSVEVYSIKYQFIIWSVLIYLILNFKLILYSTLDVLIPKQTNLSYYTFNYKYPLFFFGLAILVYSIFQHYFQIQFTISFFIFIFFLFYAWLLIRWLFISTRYKVVDSVYFLLYICTLEILPILWILSEVKF